LRHDERPARVGLLRGTRDLGERTSSWSTSVVRPSPSRSAALPRAPARLRPARS
jgi:hypothetical protein